MVFHSLLTDSNDIESAIIDDYTTNSGTSFASPIVSETTALILPVNPDLTVQQVRDIIESVAQKSE